MKLKHTFEQRVLDRLTYESNPDDILCVLTSAGDVLSQIVTACSKIKDIDSCWDELFVYFPEDDETMVIESKIHIQYKEWTNAIRIVMFSLLGDGFTWVKELNAFQHEMDFS